MFLSTSEVSRLIAMEGIATKPAIRTQVETRVKGGLCLIPTCECVGRRRGLCDAHYQQFLRTLRDKPRAERIEFETALIRKGLVLGSHEMKQMKRPNPFLEATE